MVFTYTTAQLNIPIPEFKNTINQVDTSKKILKILEKVAAELDIKITGLAGASDSYLKISGSQSSVTLQSSEATFVVKLPDSDTDPATYIELYKFDSDKDRRRVKISSRQMFGKTKNVNIPKVDLTFLKISASNYLITIPQMLKRGNYGFIVDPASVIPSGATLGSNHTGTVFAFDIN